MNRIRPWLEINPILVKELRSRMRGGRAFLTLTLLLLATGGALIGMIVLVSNIPNYGRAMLSAEVGSILFSMLVNLELLIVCVVAPAVTAGAISGEIEKLTFDLLLATSLSPVRILWGKLLSALSYVLLLLFAAVPLASIVFVFGGITLTSMLKALAMLLLTAVMVGMMGLFFSALFRRTGRATIVSLMTVVVLLLGPIFISAVLLIIRNQEISRWLIALSPISAVTSTILSPGGQQSYYNPISSLFLGGTLNQSLVPVSSTAIPRPVYHYSLVLYSVLTVIFYMGAVSLVDPTRRWRLNKKQILLGLGIFFILAAATAGVFFTTAGHYEWYTPPSVSTPAEGPGMMTPFVTPMETQRVIVPEEALSTPTPTPVPVSVLPNG